jgi:hypothetical protein
MKVNLILDSNNIFYSSTDLTKYAKRLNVKIPKTFKRLGSLEQVELFVDKIEYDVIMLLENIKVYDDIYLVQDSSSWRKKVLINGEYSYKRNRKTKNDDIDWAGYERGVNTFLEKNSHIKRFKVDGLEGDDLIYLINEHLLNDSEDNLNIIVSTDSDFKQLLKPRTIIYNQHWKNPRFVVSNDFDFEYIKYLENKNKKNNHKVDDSVDLFDVSFLNIKNKPKSVYSYITENFDIEKVNRWEGICTKIISGDDKDNVPSIYTWKKPDKVVKGIVKEGDWVRITPKYIKLIFDEFKEKKIEITPKNMFQNFNLIFDSLEKSTKQNLNRKEILESMKRNYMLLVLNKKNIPEILNEKFSGVYNSIEMVNS